MMAPAPAASSAIAASRLPWWLRDFRHVRLAALVFGVTAVLSVAAIAWTRAQWHDARARQVQAAQARELARRQFQQVEQEKHEIALYRPLYEQLLARRLVGMENRLDWLDSLRRLQQQYQLMPISYDIAPRQPVVVSPSLDLGRYRLYATRMRIQMDLLHEGDLFVLLSGLRTVGHSTVQECDLKRPPSASNAPLAPTVSAVCTLNWVTLADGDGTMAVAPGGSAGGAAGPSAVAGMADGIARTQDPAAGAIPRRGTLAANGMPGALP